MTIVGQYFGATQGSSTVTFNGTQATPTSWSDTQIVAPVPSGATTGKVQVTVNGIVSNGGYGPTFTVGTPPTVSYTSPASGPIGTVVTIVGQYFGATQGSSTVTFNGTQATPTSWSDTQIVAPVPSGATTGKVQVTVNGIVSNGGYGPTFTVGTIPSVSYINPMSGPVGTSVTITGRYFGTTQGSSTVKFNGTQATPTSWSDTQIVVPVPSGATTGKVLVTVNGIVSDNGNGVTYTVGAIPSVSYINPMSGPVGTSVTITGRYFGTTQGSSTVTFNGTQATPTSWSDTQIVVPVPSGATTGKVLVTVNGIVSDNGNGVTYTVGAIPSVSYINPMSGPVGTSVTITGRYFGATQGSSTVKFNGTQATPTSWSDTQIVVPVPSGATTGKVLVTVNGIVSDNGNGVTFTVPVVPIISSVSPASGGIGTSVTITGSNFGATQGSSTVKFNGTLANLTGWSSTSISVTVPNGAATGNVVVNVGGTDSNGLNFVVGTPPSITVAAFPPPNAAGWNTTNVTLTYTCTPGSAPIASCPPQRNITTDGANQSFVGTVTDTNGLSASATATLSIERTPPALTVSSPVDQFVSSSQSLAVSGTSTNSLTNINSVTCNGATASTSAGAFSCNLSLTPGVNLVMVRATDVAGNVSGVRLHVSYAAALPAPNSLQISPANANVLVGGTQQFTAVDELGHPRTDATWAVDDSSIATISTDASPTLTGVAAGTVNLTASIGSVTSQIQVNILSGTSLPAGTVLWSAPSTPAYSVRQMIRATPALWAPDLYSVELGAGGNPTTRIKAMTADGQILWQSQFAAAYNGPAIPDGSGGLLLNLFFPGSSGGGVNSIVDIDMQTGAQILRYDSDPVANAGVAAVGPDGTVYVGQLTSTPGLAPTFDHQTFFSGTLIALDPISGAPKLSYTGPQSSITVSYACNGTSVTQSWAPGPGGVAIGADGTVYAELAAGTTVGTNSCTGPDVDPHFYDINSSTQTLYLLQIPPSGSPSLTPIHTDSSLVGGFVEYSVIPDGQGGALAPWSHSRFNGVPGDNHVTHVLSGGGQSDFPLSLMPFEMVLGDNGTAFATDSLNVLAFDITSGQPKWTYTVPDPDNDIVDIVTSIAGGGLITKLTDLSTFPNSPETIIRLDSTGTAMQDSWTSVSAASLGASGLIDLQFLASDGFWGRITNSGAFSIFASGTPVDFPVDSGAGEAMIPVDGKEVSYHIPLTVYQVRNTTVAPQESIPVQMQKTQEFWAQRINGLKLDWNGPPNPVDGCTSSDNCQQYPTADLTNYRPSYYCVESTAWDALTIRYTNSPKLSQGIKFIFVNNIVFIPPPFNGPAYAIETVPTYDISSTACPAGNDIVMSSQAYANVGAHAVGHVFGLPDLNGNDARGPSGPNLMCSGEPICGNSSQIGSYLTYKQVIDAQKGMLQWLPKPN